MVDTAIRQNIQLKTPETQTGEEKDLGVLTTSDLKSSTQCNKAANKAMSVLRMVNRVLEDWTRMTSWLFTSHSLDLIWNTVSRAGTHTSSKMKKY